MRVYWIRHSKAESNEKLIWKEDPKKQNKLTKEGISQAKLMADNLKDAKIDAIFTSEFPRTKQTAEIINKFHNVKVIESKLINERKTGYEGKKNAEILPLIEKGILGKDGETLKQLKERIHKFIENIKTKKYKSVLIITHGAVIQVFKGIVNNLPDEDLRYQSVGHMEIIEQRL